MSMKALIYHGPGKNSLDDVPIPSIEHPKDAIVKLSATTICGTDLHILKGDVPETGPGTILGHEGIGFIYELGSGVKRFKQNEKVLISCVTSCGECVYCRKKLQSHCIDGGWILGHNINGTQAEYIRIPHADHSLYSVERFKGKVPDQSLLMCSDILPTGNEIGTLSGKINKGDLVAIVGAGSVGISTLLTSKTFEPSLTIMIDPDEERLKAAKELFGADVGINPLTHDVKKEIEELSSIHNTGDRDKLSSGVDVAIECVGIPQTFQTCQDIIAPGGRIANVGVHGKKVDLQLQELWIKNINISTGLVSAYSTSELLAQIEKGNLKPFKLVTHTFKFSDMLNAYKIFAESGKHKCIKTFIEFDN